MYTKEKILLSCFDEDIIFEDILQKLIAYDDNVKFEEIADTMDNTEHIKLCDRLLKYTTNCIQLLNLGGNNHSDDTNKDMTDENENVIRDLQTVSDFIMLYAVLPKYRPYSLTATIQCLHDILILLVTEESSADNTKTSDNKHNSIVAITSLRSSISRICEYWWTHKEVGAENFITQLVPHLLVTALKPTAHESDVKRLHKVSGALLLLDFEDESIESIRSLLLRCTESVLFLKSSEGRRFLAFLFSVHIDLHGPLLEVFRMQLVDCAPRVATACGEVLYYAWKHTQVAQERESIEDCLQTLVHEAIHASEPRYFKSLRLTLSVFHEAKRHHGVDTMLLRTYGPILWRSLRCANAFVRVQATMIFFDSFPLQDEEAAAAEADAILQKQFDLLTSMLKDCDQRVRAAAASGVCRVLREFWSALPPATTRQALSYVVGTLGRDAACANVRVAVMTGLCDLLEQPLAHGVMKSLLPILANSIHDTSERVRVAFIQILCKVKQIKGLTFYSIVTVENLLARLEDDRDRPAVCSQMTALLLNSFLPQLRADDCDERGIALDAHLVQEKEAEQCRRCIDFLDKNSVTAVTFYSHVHEHAPLQTVVRLVINLFQLLVNTSSFAASSADEPIASKGTKNKAKVASKKDTKSGKRDRADPDSEEVTRNTNSVDSPLLQSPAMYVSILTTIHAILTSIQKKLTAPGNLRIRETVCNVLSRQQISALMNQAQSLLSVAAFVSDNTLESASQHLPDITCQYLKIVALVEGLRKGLDNKSIHKVSSTNPQIDAGAYADDWNSARFVHRFDRTLFEGGKASSNAVVVRAQARAVVETVLTFGDFSWLLDVIESSLRAIVSGQNSSRERPKENVHSSSSGRGRKRKSESKLAVDVPAVSLHCALELLSALYTVAPVRTLFHEEEAALTQLFQAAREYLEFALNQSQRNTNSLATSCLRLWLLTAAHTQIQRKGETDSINDVLSLSSAFSWVKQHAICSESSRDSNSDDSISLFRANLLAMSLLVLSDLVCMKQAAVEVAAVLPVWVDATESLVSGSLTRQEEAPSVASILVPVLCRLTCILAALSSSQQESKPQIKTPKHFFSEADFTRVVSSLGRIMSAVSDATEGLSVVLPTVTASMVQKSIQHLERASLIYATQLDDDIDEVV